MNNKEYVDKFAEFISDAEYVENSMGQKLLLESRSFRQCYDSKDKARSQLPPYWFCDQDGNVISIAKDKPMWLVPENNHGRAAYHFVLIEDGTVNKKIIRRASLCGIVWGSYRYGKADEVLSTEGIYGFGTNSSTKLTVSCHHKDEDKTNDNYNNLEFGTNRAHLQTIHKVPESDDIDSQRKFIKRLSDMACEEEPDKVTLLITGNGYKELVACDSNQLPDNLKESIRNTAYQVLVSQYVEILLQTYGKEYFEEDRFLYIVPTRQILKVQWQKADRRLAISIPNISEISNKEMIACCMIDGKAAVLLERED